MEKHRIIVSVLIVITGIIFIAIGVFGGEADDLLTKSTAICLECVGIG